MAERAGTGRQRQKQKLKFMIRLLEIYYLVGVPLGLGIFVAAFFTKKARLCLLVTSVALVGIWTMNVNLLSSRSTLMIKGGDYPQTAGEILRTFGTPEYVIDYPVGYSTWFYTVRVRPWNTLLVYYVVNGRVLALQHSEKVGFFFKPEQNTQGSD